MTILICLDFSNASDIVLREVNELTKQLPGSQVYVHTVQDINVLAYDQGFDDSIARALEEEAEELRRKAEAVFGRDRIIFSSAPGQPVPGILDRARELKCDLLILGTHGRTGLDHVLIGSVAEQVLRSTEWNTLVIPVKKELPVSE